MNQKTFAGTCFVVFFVLCFFSSNDAGAADRFGWMYQNPYPTSVNLFDVAFATPEKGWVVGKHGTILSTIDGGENWAAQESGTESDLIRVFFSNGMTGWAVGTQGAVLQTTDGGKTWSEQFNIKAWPTCVYFLDDKKGWITGIMPQGVVYQTENSGTSWEKVETGIDRAVSSVYFHSPKVGWLLSGEIVYRTVDGGKKWSQSVLPVAMVGHLNDKNGRNFASSPFAMDQKPGADWWHGDLKFVDGQNGWAVINQGQIFNTTDGGKTWIVQFDAGPMSYGFSHVSFRNGKNGCVSGSTIFCTADGGRTWQEQLGVRRGDGKSLGGIVLVGQESGWVVGNNGLLLRTTDGGKSWDNMRRVHECGLGNVFINHSTGWFFSGVNGSHEICKTVDSGLSWERQPVGMEVRSLSFMSETTGWAAGIIRQWRDDRRTGRLKDLLDVWGVVKKTVDGGKTWVTQFKESMGKEGNHALSGITFVDQNRGWIVGTKGTILSTVDGGNVWQQRNANAEYSLYRPYFVDSQRGWIAGMQVNKDGWTGILLYTENGGREWKLQFDKKGIGFNDVCFLDAATGWMVGSSEYGGHSRIYTTKNAGKSWTEVHFTSLDVDSLWFADRTRGIALTSTSAIFITKDGGRSWHKKLKPLKKEPWSLGDLFL